MTSRRQSMRVVSQTSASTVSVTKTSYSSTTTTSTPLSGKRTRKSEIFSLPDASSPGWISGSDFVFKSPKSPFISRRATIHQSRHKAKDDFKIPSLMFSSPPGVKTRSRRSSIYSSSQQKKTKAKAQNQPKEPVAVKRAGKSAPGKKNITQITAERVLLTDVSLISSPVGKGKNKDGAKGKMSSKVKSPRGRSTRARNSSTSKSEKDSLDNSGYSPIKSLSPNKSLSPISPKKRGTRARGVKKTEKSPAEIAAKPKDKTPLSKAKSPRSVKKKSPGKKSPATPITRPGSPMVKSVTKTRSVKRSTRYGKSMTPSPSRKVKDTPSTTEIVKASISPKCSPTPSKVLKTKSIARSSKRKRKASPEKIETTPIAKAAKRSPSPKAKRTVKSSKSEVSPKTPEMSSVGSTRRPSTRKMKSNIQLSPNNQGTPILSPIIKLLRTDSPKSKRSITKKKSSIKRDKGNVLIDQEDADEESPSIPAEKPASTKSQRAKKKETTHTPSTPSPQVKKDTPSRQRKQQTPSRVNKKLSSPKSQQTKTGDSGKKTPSRRETVRRLSSPGKQASLSKVTKKSPTVRPPHGAGGTPRSVTRRRSLREINVIETLKKTDRSGENTKSPSEKIFVRRLSSPRKQASPSIVTKKSPTVRPSHGAGRTPRSVTRRRSLREISVVETMKKADTKDTKSPSEEIFVTRSPSRRSTNVHPTYYDMLTKGSSSNSSLSTRITGSVSSSIISKEVDSRASKTIVTEMSKSQVSSRLNDKGYAISPYSPSARIVSQEKSTPISSRDSLSSSRVSRRLTSLKKTTPSTISHETYSHQEQPGDSLKSLSPFPWRKQRFQTEAEEIDSMVSTMVKASSSNKWTSSSSSTYVSKASPARAAIMKERESEAAPTSLDLDYSAGRKSLRISRNFTPSAAAPKARKVLGILDTASESKNISQSCSTVQHTESSSVTLGRSTRSNADNMKGFSTCKDAEEEEEEEEKDYRIQEESVSRSNKQKDISEQNDEDMTDSENSDDYNNDLDVTLSHTSHSQRCTIC